MFHPSDGALRRHRDEPFAVADSVDRHLEGCPRCQARVEELSADATFAQRALSVPVAAPDATGAFNRFRAAAAAAPPPPAWRTAWERRFPGSTAAWRPALAVAVALCLVGLVTVMGVASPLRTFFEPRQIQPVAVSPGELQGLPNLSDYGTMRFNSNAGPEPAGSLAAAAALSGLQPLHPTFIPRDVPAAAHYDVLPASTASFTFSAAKVRAAAARQHRSLPAMPAGIDGATINVSYGPGIVEYFTQPGSGQQLPALAIVQMRTPQVTSTGVTVTQIEDYLLSQPGVSPDLKRQIKAIGDPSATLPVPILLGRTSERPVTVQGVTGIAFGDSTGLGAGALWIKGGNVYAVAGTISQAEILEVANSLRS